MWDTQDAHGVTINTFLTKPLKDFHILKVLTQQWQHNLNIVSSYTIVVILFRIHGTIVN